MLGYLETGTFFLKAQLIHLPANLYKYDLPGELVTQPIGTAPCVAFIPSYRMLSVAATSLYGSSIHISAASGLDLRSIWNLSEILLCLLVVSECWRSACESF